MHIFAVANQKGGTGKTTVTINLGAALARAEKHILLVDLDPQGSLTEYFTNPETLQQTIYDALLNGVTVAPLKLGEQISLLPANIDLAAAEIQLPAKRFQERTLSKILKNYTGYDYCLIDCPPSLGVLTTNALTAAQSVIIPVSTELLAERTVKLIIATIEDIQSNDPTSHLQIWRILATIYDQRLAHHREILEALRVKYGQLLYGEPVRATTKYKDAVTERVDAGDLDKKIADYWDTLANVLIEESEVQ
jgi:chromosome partitioning protein